MGHENVELGLGLMEDIINNAKEPRTGFNIGADIAFYRLKLDTTNEHIIQGYESCANKDSSRNKTDVYIRKWLTLRMHAFERGLHFSPDVTVEFLKEMFIETNQKCPFTHERLTQGSLESSDWSIDRLCSEFGYVAFNLAVMSTGLNKAKSDLSIKQLKFEVKNKLEFRGYSAVVWQRVINRMFVVNGIVNDYDEITRDADAILQNPYNTLCFFLENVLSDESRAHEESFNFFMGVLVKSASGNNRLINEIEEVAKKLLLKSKGKQIEILPTIERSKTLKRRLERISNRMNMDYFIKETEQRKELLKQFSSEAIGTQKVRS